MLEDMQLRGLSAKTQEAYARAVWQLAQYYRRRPDQLSEEELRQYFLYLTNEKKLARPTATIALCGIKFFYEQTLQQHWPTLRFFSSFESFAIPLSDRKVQPPVAKTRRIVFSASSRLVCSKAVDALSAGDSLSVSFATMGSITDCISATSALASSACCFASLASRRTRSESVLINAREEIAATRQKPAKTNSFDLSPGVVALPRIESMRLLEIMLRKSGTMNDAASPTQRLLPKYF